MVSCREAHGPPTLVAMRSTAGPGTFELVQRTQTSVRRLP